MNLVWFGFVCLILEKNKKKTNNINTLSKIRNRNQTENHWYSFFDVIFTIFVSILNPIWLWFSIRFDFNSISIRTCTWWLQLNTIKGWKLKEHVFVIFDFNIEDLPFINNLYHVCILSKREITWSKIIYCLIIFQ